MTIGLINLARIYAEASHEDQVRKYTGEPYICHPARVTEILKFFIPDASPEMVAAAWLHDVVEDTTARDSDIVAGFGSIVAALVWELTSPNKPVSTSGCAIKACDMLDNLGTIANVAPHHQAKTYLAKKAPEVLFICGNLETRYPALAEALAQAWWRNWEAVT